MPNKYKGFQTITTAADSGASGAEAPTAPSMLHQRRTGSTRGAARR
jgi:hypothetical protein